MGTSKLWVLTALVALSGCGRLSIGGNETLPKLTGGREHALADYGFAISVPPDWQVAERGTLPLKAVLPPRAGQLFGDNLNVASQAVPAGVTIADIDRANVQQTTSQYAGLVDEERHTGTVDGRPAVWHVFSFPQAFGTVKVFQVVVLDGARAFVITGMSLADSFVTTRPIYEQVAGTFRVL